MSKSTELSDPKLLDALVSVLKKAAPPVSDAPSLIMVALRNRKGQDDFNDWLGWYDVYTGALRLWEGTTDPGYAPRLGTGRVSTNPKGVGRILPGWWPKVYSYGWHHSSRKHPCLKHNGCLGIERFDLGALEWVRDKFTYNRSFNVHRAGSKGISKVVSDYSHGCLVFANRVDHWDFLVDMGFPEHGFEGDLQRPSDGRVGLLLIDITDLDL